MKNTSLCISGFTLEQIPSVAEKVVDFNKDVKVFCFYGSMGAGKTTLIKAICEHLKVLDNVSSPTFAIVNEYKRKDADSVYHFDFYRIKDIREVYDIGYEDYFYSGRYCFIEWPELIGDILPDRYIKVEITEVEPGLRDMVLTCVEEL